ncbi:RNA polymerase recycling motor HelD [Paenibacillus glycanilyticus]|uniref:DNA helicase n=1 Tax=Paenibacillus glycanilyticus TaxID=126569 RepID=A0ABQ6GII9_9BACL|nr:RNA polymerase recycling motor HelD [Paenibacillus glycanilyticus]GLX69138.1 DNA helicase [Paenibacillus glycanilyticus]
MQDEQHKEEQKRVDRVMRIIREQLGKLLQTSSGMREDIVDIRKNFWDDVTLNFEDAAEAAESAASLKQQAEVLAEREHSHRHAAQQVKMLRKLEQTPYFGRVDFIEEGSSNEERIYLGIGSMLDENSSDYLIYDWRAPVSSLYYDYSPGPARYDTPIGTIAGEMKLKRQFVIRRGQIVSMFDTGVTIGDELLQEVLGKQSDSQMRSIVATIQREQNQIIRNERARLLIVQGAAGSGKTSAALQRVAYLLYRYRGTLQADQIVLFSPNPMFNSYVATVLPELGEQNMQQTTYQQYLEHRIGQSFALEDPFAQMEYTLGGMDDPDYETRMASIRHKSGAAFMKVIDQYVESLGRSGLLFKSIKFRGRKLISAEEIEQKFYGLDGSYSIPNRLKMVADWMLKELTRLSKEERKKQWVEDEMELLDKEEYIHAYNEMRRKTDSDFFDDFEREKDILATMIVQERFKRLRSRVKKLRFIDTQTLYRRLYERDLASGLDPARAEEWAAISKLTAEQLNLGVLTYEDATPYLYMKDLIEGFQTNTSVRHLFIDEAQDYSPFQFYYLKRVFPMAKMTALGDLNQSIFAHAALGNGFDPLGELYSKEETETIVLTRSYRSTKQIVEFTSLMIEGGSRIVPFNRHGEEPTITEVSGKEELHVKIEERIRLLEEEGAQSIAIICKTAEESKAAFEALAVHCPGMRLIEKETVTFENGIVVIPSYLAKGVEFDAVILYNASSRVYGKESERKLFYTACTRAMHELHLYYTDEPSPFLSRVVAEKK